MLRALTDRDFDTVHTAFIDAFSDYVLKFAPTREQLQEMLTRRGYVPELSVGAFEGERMVAFTLNGRTGSDAYDTGTGVVPSHRRRGLAKQMLRFVEDRLRGAGCTRYVLEVIDSNAAAIALYLADGFRETRRLGCWTYDRDSKIVERRAPSPAESSMLGGRGRPPLHRNEDSFRAWWDIQPSWQNATASLQRATLRQVTIGDEHGYAIVVPEAGDLPRLAVNPRSRRQGIGTKLLDAAATLAGKQIRIINVDTRNAGITAFLTAAGARLIVTQIEMEKYL